MEDSEIVALYWLRDEGAIRETDAKYGPLCRRLALDLLGSPEDAEECVNDTYFKAWNSMPEERPGLLRPWLGRVLRNTALDRWRRDHRQKRYDGVERLLSELEDCVPSRRDPQRELEAAELGQMIDRWLRSLPQEEERLFLRRYWYGESVKDLAAEARLAPSVLAQRLRRLRLRLRSHLEKEGIVL